MRQSRETEVLWAVSMNPQGVTWSTLEQYFPKKTLARHLKNLTKEGMIERILEPRIERKKGRQQTRYRLLDCHFAVKIPCKFVGRRWFPGKTIRRLPKNRLRGTTHVRLTGEVLRQYKDALRDG